MGLFGGGSKPKDPEPTPQETAAAEVAAKEFHDFSKYYLPLELQHINRVKAQQSPYILRQKQLRAETPYLTRFRGLNVSPGSLEPRLMQHQIDMELQRGSARQIAISDHFSDYTRQLMEVINLGRGTAVSANQADLARARDATQYQLAREQAGAIRQGGRYQVAGQLGGMALAKLLS